MFLANLYKITRGLGNDGVKLDLYTGKSHGGVDVLVAVVYPNTVAPGSAFVKKIEKSKFDKEIEMIVRNSKSVYSSWISQDYTSLSPLQQEEAAQVRGMLVEDDEALESIQRLIKDVEKE